MNLTEFIASMYQHLENAFFLFLVNSKITSISKSKNKGTHAGEKERAMAVVKYLHRTRIVLTGVCIAIEILKYSVIFYSVLFTVHCIP